MRMVYRCNASKLDWHETVAKNVKGKLGREVYH